MDTLQSIQLLRQTVTGNFSSILFSTEDVLKLTDQDGERHVVQPGSRVLVIQGPCLSCNWMERLLRAAEIMLHGVYSTQSLGERVVTTDNVILMLGQHDIGEDDVSF